MIEFVNLKVTGFAMTKNNSAEYNENLNFNPAESAIYDYSGISVRGAPDRKSVV
jgi:hypothetical protein